MIDLSPIQRLEERADFQALPYSSQSTLRTIALTKVLKDNQEFARLNPKIKAQVINAVQSKAPSFADKKFEKIVSEIGARLQKGDEKATKLANATVNAKALWTSSVIANLVFSKIALPLLEENEDNWWPNAAEDAQQWLRLQHMTPATHKAAEYFDTILSQDKAQAKRNNTIRKVAQIGGMVFDIAVMEALTAGTLAHPFALGKLLVTPIKKASLKAATQLGRKAILTGAAVTHASITAMVGVGRENALRLLNGMENSSTGQEILHNNARYFRNYFLGDFLFNFASGIMWPMIKSMGRNVKGWGQHKLFYPGVTAEQLQGLMGDVTELRFLDPELMHRLPQEIQRTLLSHQAALATLKQVEKIQPEEVFKYVGLAHGFDIVRDGDVLKAFRSYGKRTLKTTSTVDEMGDWLAKQIGQPTLDLLDDVSGSAVGAIKDKYKITQTLKGTLVSGTEQEAGVLANLIAPVNGKFTTEKVKGFFRMYLKANGADATLLKTVDVLDKGSKIVVTKSGAEIARLPKYIRSGTDEYRQVVKLLAAGDNLTTGQGGRLVARELIEKYQDLLGKQQLYTPAWVEHATEIEFGVKPTTLKGGRYRIGKTEFGSSDELGNFIIKKTTTFDNLKRHLKTNEGLTLARPKDLSEVSVYHGRKKIYSAKNLDELLGEYPELLPKIDARLGPELTYIERGNRIGVSYTHRIAHGNYEEILKELNKFSKFRVADEITILGKNGAKLKHNKFSRIIEVEVPEIAGRKTFTSATAAKKWMNGGWKDFDELKKLAATKGFRFETWNGEFVLYSKDGTKYVARNFDELTAIYREVPVPEWLPELSGMADEIYQPMAKPPEDFYKPFDFGDIVSEKEIGAWTSLSQIWRPEEGFLVKATEKGADPFFLKSYRQIEDTLQLLRHREQEAAKVITSIWRFPEGKMLNKKRRVAIRDYLQAKPADKGRLAEFYKLTEGELEVARMSRTMFGEHAEAGMFALFDVKPERFLDEYMPRMAEWIKANPTKLNYPDNARTAFYRDVFGDAVPKDLDAFFKYERVSDIMNMALEQDPYRLMLKYSSIGHRQMILGPIWSKIDDHIKANPGMNEVVKTNFNIYRGRIMGLPQGNSEKLMRTFTEKALQRWGLSPNLTKDFTRAAMSWAYLASLGARPWIWMRNMHQIWTTLAPRIGNRYVKEAVQQVASDPKARIFDLLRHKGIIQQNLPLYGSEIFDASTIMGKITHQGLKRFKNSDEFTRAVAWTATSNRFDDAVRRLKAGTIKTREQFLDFSGMWQLPPDLRKKALQLIQGDPVANISRWTSARDLFATEMTSNTMFAYRAGMSPVSFRGTVGKLFGMFGTYPVFYVENIKRALKYGTVGQKVAYGATFLANTTLLYEGYKALGVEAKNFIWYHPALFTGGPMYQMMNTSLQMMSPNYKGAIARAEMVGLTKTKDGKLHWDPAKSEGLKWIIPGSFLFRSWHKALQSLNAGNNYGAVLNFTSMPVSPDAF